MNIVCVSVIWIALAVTVAAAPNVIVILADDMGVGDVSALNPKSAWRTPQLDRMAAAGRVFTDAHSPSGVCTPTRYALLTGRYSWRGTRKSGVTYGYDAALIEAGRGTIASMLSARGYTSAVIGKWHLGLDWTKVGPKPEDVDYTQPFARGPIALGFDYFYGISASLDMPPYVYLENNRVENSPTRIVPASVNPAFWRAGPAAAEFSHAGVQPRLIVKTETFLAERAAATDGKPFFLYLALAAPHTPISPTFEFAGKSRVNAYGDFVQQVDADVGRIRAALEKHGFTRDTLVIFTADNGCSPEARFEELRAAGHDPQAGRRGAKADLYEGGHRVPFIACWPERIPAGTASDQLLGLNDLFATVAELAGAKIPRDTAEDSISMVPALTGTPKGPLREALLHHSINGSFAIRAGKWKLLFAPDSGGWSEPRPPRGPASGIAPLSRAAFQLFDLLADPSESKNLAADRPEVVEQLGRTAKGIVENGRLGLGPQPLTPPEWPQLAWMRLF